MEQLRKAFGFVRTLTPARRWMALAAAAGTVALAAAAWSGGSGDGFERLAAGAEDRGRVTERLDRLGVARQERADGVYVRAADRAWIESELLGREEPATGGLFETPPQQRERAHAAFESALARMVSRLDCVSSAQVKVVAPERSPFRSATEATASIVVEAKGAFGKAQARAVATLLCGAVQGLKPANVTVCDTKGKLHRLDGEEGDPREQEQELAAWIEEQVGKLFPQWRRAAHVRLPPGTISIPGQVPAGAEISLSVVIPDDAPGVPRDPALREAFVKEAIGQIHAATGVAPEAITVQLLPLPAAEPSTSPGWTTAAVATWPQAALLLVGIVLAGALMRRRPKAAVAAAAPSRADPFGFLEEVSVDRAVMLLRDEHAQSAALVLAHLAPDRAGTILERLPAGHQVEIVKRLSALEVATPEAVAQVERSLEAKLGVLRARETIKSGGPRTAAAILSRMRQATETQLMVAMMDRDPQLAERIRNAADSL
jgi:hypothetical protein